MKKNTLFIHSLFRSGSTYLFHVFRRASDNNFCYQEPFNECIFNALEDPKSLMALKGSSEMQRLLKHPEIGRPYFAEFYDTFDQWKSTITPEVNYDDYFGLVAPEKTNKYLDALINAPQQKNVVIQACRTGARMGNIKSQLGGHHVYLWRNPWDQWWSSKSTEYFEVILQVIASAKVIPSVIKLICDANGIAILPNHPLEQQKQHFEQRWVTPQNSYILFFALWCINMIQGLKHADILLSVDELSQNKAYSKSISDKFSVLGFSEIDFTDCNITQSTFTSIDADFFRPIEEKVYEYLLETGVSEVDIEGLRKLCFQSTPILQNVDLLPNSERHYVQSVGSLRSIILSAQEGREREGSSSNTQISIINTQVRELRKDQEKSALELSSLRLDRDDQSRKAESLQRNIVQLEATESRLKGSLLEVNLDRATDQAKILGHQSEIKSLNDQIIEYQKLLDAQIENVKHLSQAVDAVSTQNQFFSSNLEEERKHNVFLQTEHKDLLQFISEQEQRTLKTNKDLLQLISDQAQITLKTNEDHQGEREELSKCIDDLRSANKALNFLKQHAESELLAQIKAKEGMLYSSSWRITQPIRSIFNLKVQVKSFVRTILLKGLPLVRSSRTLKTLALFPVGLIPGMKAKFEAFSYANPKPKRIINKPLWNLQLEKQSTKTWISVLKKGSGA